MTTSPKEPYLKSERHFRLYEHYVKTIVDSWPQQSIFTPSAPVASTETLASRIRICIGALLDNIQDNDELWQVSFSVTKFIQIADQIVVSNTAIPGRVVCGPRDVLRRRTPLGVQVEPTITQVIPRVNLVACDNKELIHAIVVLHHHRLLSEPSTIETPFSLEDYAETHDVALELESTDPVTKMRRYIII